MPNSTNVSDGQDTLAAQYNNLRLDVFDTSTGHDHDGTSSGGKKVNHSNLVDDDPIANTYLTHAEINKHVQGTDNVDGGSDSPGGDQGVHGLAAAAYVAGVFGHQAGDAVLTGLGGVMSATAQPA